MGANSPYANLDHGQVLNQSFDDDNDALRVVNLGSLVPKTYDYIGLTYVAAGNGAGEIETITYKTGGSGGTTQATITLSYNSDNKITGIART